MGESFKILNTESHTNVMNNNYSAEIIQVNPSSVLQNLKVSMT